jgi:hypothetical protein
MFISNNQKVLLKNYASGGKLWNFYKMVVVILPHETLFIKIHTNSNYELKKNNKKTILLHIMID